ncbi:MAG TPA: B12-binding domain-containing radical SAM protein, partial [Rikenellaceae bacterium]|nr:B12-binding domain-containing radical SAM protein [Rikenellaceae bacterium]
MRILWLDINASYSHSSLAIPALHAQLSETITERYSWRVVSGSINRETTYYLSEIAEFSPDIILSTLWLFNHKKVLSVLERAKALSPNIRIILGGP